jgi:predicted nucleic acid-binding protein
LKQRRDQIIAQLTIYLDTLKTLLLEFLSKSQRANNLLFALHDYIQKVIKRKLKSCMTRHQIEEIALIIERIEDRLEKLNRARNEYQNANRVVKQINNTRQIDVVRDESRVTNLALAMHTRARYSSVRDKSQEYVNSDRRTETSYSRRARDDDAFSNRARTQVSCYSCDKSRHIRSNCLNNSSKKDSSS